MHGHPIIIAAIAAIIHAHILTLNIRIHLSPTLACQWAVTATVAVPIVLHASHVLLVCEPSCSQGASIPPGRALPDVVLVHGHDVPRARAHLVSLVEQAYAVTSEHEVAGILATHGTPESSIVLGW